MHKVGNIEDFDRAKYITIHTSISSNWPSGYARDKFLSDYDVFLGRETGGLTKVFNKI